MTNPTTSDQLARVVASINALVKREVLVGIPGETTERKQDGQTPSAMNNATLGYIHEFGSPAANIPARPFLVPGVQDASEKIGKRLGAAAKAALNGQGTQAIEQALTSVGLVAQASVKAKINSGDFVPLADSTLKARARKGRQGAKDELASRAAGNDPGTQGAKPLINTGELRNSINFTIKGI